MTTSSLPENYLAFLQEQSDAIVDAVAGDAIEQIPAYRALPPGAAQRSIGQTLANVLQSMQAGDFASLVEWVNNVLLVRFEQGLTFDQANLLPSLFRQRIIEASLVAFEQRIPGTPEGITFVNRACDRIVEMISHYYHQRIETTAAELRRFQLIAESALDGIAVGDAQFMVSYANPAFRRLTGYDEIIGTPVRDLLDPSTIDTLRDTIFPALQSAGGWSGEVNYRHADGTIFPVQISIGALHDEAGAFSGTTVIVRDIREQRSQESERARLQDEIIQMQQLALRELSTPLLAVSDRVMVLPLVGSIDSRRAQQVIETLLEGISTTGADTAILDITGVPVVDTQVANALLRAAQAVRLLGAQVVLTGIRPEVAQTLVGLGADMREIVSRSTLQSGIAYAMGARAAQGSAGVLAK
jgi:anti-anti-sigma factor